MAAFVMGLPQAVKDVNVGEALSGIFGSVSLTAWICLLLPQLITNYKTKSADALSMKFLLIWLLGDVANLSGALWTSLAPSTIALAFYFCIADLILITQCTYYNAINARRRRRAREQRHPHSAARTHSEDSDTTAVYDGDADTTATHANETTPLITGGPHPRRSRRDSAGLPGSHRRRSARRASSNLDPLTRIITGEDDTPDSNPWLHNAVSLVAVWIVGAAGWLLSYKMGAWGSDNDGIDPSPTPDHPDDVFSSSNERQATIGLMLGYFSAVCYLCARIPQIIKNYKEKSCEGLALLFFLLSLTGNLTYGASVMAYSQERAYLLRALPWLLGSLGTMVEDFIIFVQFRIYSPERKAKATVAP
ncbi:putative vacuolar amino acid transporter YPQ1 [Cladorrhinum samala]|uniref:Vacuolar amino acid transporter YPQ1 n=1 Tax=Cladorrhinum samala TaxID=585594 RepID=A0AAV9I1V4_9PEZI|nr:putative vacuolar amino acid transporter YPQ1 [Cladorrhinum samala]